MRLPLHVHAYRGSSLVLDASDCDETIGEIGAWWFWRSPINPGVMTSVFLWDFGDFPEELLVPSSRPANHVVV